MLLAIVRRPASDPCAQHPPPPPSGQVKPRTESGRDAMLRAGVRAAMAAAQEGSLSLLGGDQPNK